MNIVFMGTPDFAVPVLEQLFKDGYTVKAVVTQPDRPKGRKKVLTPPPVKVKAEEYGVPVLQPEKVRTPEAVQAILDYEPDLIVTCAYGQILPESLLKEPKLGCINVHASLLPEYRGGAPIHHAIMDGKDETGITIMYMVKALDAGDMLTQVRVAIGPEDTVGTMHDKLSLAGASLLSETLPKLIKGELTPIPQDPDQVTYAPTIQREDERIDWSKPAQQIVNQIRGMNPFPVASTVYKGQNMKLWRAEVSNRTAAGEPGVIIGLEEDGILVKTAGETAVKLTELQPAGKKRLTAQQYLLGADMKEGDRFGEANATDDN
ncbi:methionyl-tRNA formyltransferase [Pullulanibacillus sp. KACC 23026]|uniref:methionyl-tRNA formyltransferase n=1 Tax=Pullulanibacillus sp. KACC 23026 TaxID=3028315 RepID=UPI0023AF09FC|nr:methionyl-tRNA formyltransferase [Pullulanibacillus sp. KACC 23026]WEG11629.1 methionyl-tRNA formyltransferase [Pullulanibacillus sp. KACC 23026]